MTNEMLSKMNEEQLCEYLNDGNDTTREQVKAEFTRRKVRADDWHSGVLALPVWGQPSVYRTKFQLKS